MKSRSTAALSIFGLVIVLAATVMLLPQPDAPAGTASDSPEPAGSEAPTATDIATSTTTTAIVDVRVFDGDSVVENASVVLADGRVREVGRDIGIPPDAAVIDGRGKTVLPGLIDGHVHAIGAARSAAIRFGVTTLLDMFSPPADLARIRDQRQGFEISARADVFTAGFLATAPGGHGTQYGIEVPTLSGPADADPWVAARLTEGSDWIKIVIEDGSAWGAKLATLAPETVAALVEAAHEREVMAVAHVSTYDDAMIAIESGVDGLVHLFADRPVDAAFIDAARDGEIFVVPTATVLASSFGGPGTEWLRSHEILGDRLGAMQRQSLSQSFPGSDSRESMWQTAQDNIRALHEAGIPIIAGSDAPNPGTAQGISIHAELALLVDSGLQPIDALRAATSTPARLFGLGQRGCMRAGCRADLLLVDGNPLATIQASAHIEGIWKNGHRVVVETGRRPAPGAQVDDVASSAAPASPIDLLARSERWMAAADDYLGGQSRSGIEWLEVGEMPALAVDADVESGFAFPYAGAMWNTTAIPMQPADHAGHRRLVIEIEGPGSGYQVMFFSGQAPGAQPVRVPLSPGQETVIGLGDLGGLELSSLRAIGVFATEQSDPRRFTVNRARLE